MSLVLSICAVLCTISLVFIALHLWVISGNVIVLCDQMERRSNLLRDL